MNIASACSHFPTAALLASSFLAAQSWTQTSSIPVPPFVSFNIASAISGVVLYDESANQTFVLSGGSWLLQPTTLPQALFSTMIGGGANVLRFGGIDAVGPTNMIAEFDFTTMTWGILTNSSPAPSPRFQAAGASVNTGTSIVYGGVDGVNVLGDTWQMTNVNGSAVWVPLSTPAGLGARFQSVMARGPANSAVLFGGVSPTLGMLGDTWILANGTWTQATGAGPSAAVGASMTYDVLRDMTVLVHPNGSTWEWNGFAWRDVGATGAIVNPGAQALYDGTGVSALQPQLTGGVETLAFTPSPASFQISMPNQCLAGAPQSFRLANVNRSLPIRGSILQLRLDRVSQNALLIGGFEFAANAQAPGLCNPNCRLGLTLTGATQFVPNVSGVGNWSLPIANNPVLLGMSLDLQGFAFDPAFCGITSGVSATARATIVIG